ncbi:MAG: hypothetical protein M1817_004062 [Caeruleum heppii]|nr:MAG: hypothetical protein M1817_004062 [Caeruleum heppii]
MVTLGLPTDTKSRRSAHAEESLSVREAALWFPNIPPEHFDLNEENFIGRSAKLAEYTPLVHLNFGGNNGEQLRSLVRISVLCGDSTIYGIEFHYTGDLKSQILGHFCPEPMSWSKEETFDFSIDGTGGEVIVGMDVDVEDEDEEKSSAGWRYGALRSFQVRTNLGRSVWFRPPRHIPYETPFSLAAVKLEAGTTITGLYGTPDPDWGLLSLGVITQKLDSGCFSAKDGPGNGTTMRS